MRATMCVDSPGSSCPLRATALTHPQETRILAMLTVPRVLLTTRKACSNIGPRGTEPKSLENSSNRASAQVAERAGPAAPKTAATTKPYRSIVAISCCDPQDPPRSYAPRMRRAPEGHSIYFLQSEPCQSQPDGNDSPVRFLSAIHPCSSFDRYKWLVLRHRQLQFFC